LGEEGGEVEGVGFCFGSGRDVRLLFFSNRGGFRGYRPRNEHAWPALDLEIAERLCPQDILQRDAFPALLDEIPDAQPGMDGGRGVLDVLADPAQLVGGRFQVATRREQLGRQRRDLSPGMPEERGA
jgi:hypothetical protein